MRRERGFALVTVVLFIIGLAVLATGLLYAAAQERTLVRTSYDLVRARHAADAALERALDEWSAARRSLDPQQQSIALVPPATLAPGVRMSASSTRMAGEAFLVTGIGRARDGEVVPVRHRALRLVRSPDLDSIGRALDAAALVGAASIAAPAVVDATGPSVEPVDSLASALCARWPAGAALRVPLDSLRLAADAAVLGEPAIVADTGVARFRRGLGFLDLDALRARARPIDATSITPAPVEIGARCDTVAAGSWGGATGPCASYWPLLHGPDSLRLHAGYAQGLLIVRGDLVLDAGVRFRGVILATGTVVVRNATLEGAIVAAALQADAGSIRHDRCAVASALALAQPLRAAWPASRSRIPAFE